MPLRTSLDTGHPRSAFPRCARGSGERRRGGERETVKDLEKKGDEGEGFGGKSKRRGSGGRESKPLILRSDPETKRFKYRGIYYYREFT